VRRGRAYHVWDVIVSHVLLGRTVVFGLCTTKPIKPKNLKTFFKKPRFFSPDANSRTYMKSRRFLCYCDSKQQSIAV